MVSNGKNIGYLGTGKLAVWLPKSTSAAAGSYLTSFTTSTRVFVVRPTVRIRFTLPVTITYLTRG